MGMSPFRGCELSPSQPSGNPDPSRRELLRLVWVGHTTVAEVRYADCTNMEGRKILVFKGRKVLELSDPLDPHFSEESDSPFARFVPTKEGWKEACMFAARLDIIVCGGTS